MSQSVKLKVFVLAFNVIGFAEGYLLRDLGACVVAPHYYGDGIGRGAAESAGFMIAKLMRLWRPLFVFPQREVGTTGGCANIL
jgi:hypothetical protein